MRWLDGITDSMDISLSRLPETVKDREAWHAAGYRGVPESNRTEQLNNSKLVISNHFLLFPLFSIHPMSLP